MARGVWAVPLAFLGACSCGGGGDAIDAGEDPIDGALACGEVPAGEDGVVSTSSGAVRGVREGSVWAYRGIPYAEPPVGEGRFREPVAVACREGVLDATAFAPACPQVDRPLDGSGSETPIGDEDCLYLNVWAPEDAADAPVMVFLHGGGNVQGSPADETLGVHLYDGSLMAARSGAVVVTVSYRLGPLGFLAHPELSAESGRGASGNYGILDQIAALEWVAANIDAFGGDPQRVMLFGESAGAVDVCVHLASSLSAGLFHRALMQSGGCVAQTRADAEAAGMDYAAEVGCGGPDALACLRALDPLELVAEVPAPFSGGIASASFGPVVDRYVLTDTPLAMIERGSWNEVPFVIGANADEVAIAVPVGSVTPKGWEATLELFFSEPDLSRALALYPPGTTNAQARASRIAAFTDAQFVCPSRTIARRAAGSSERPVYRYFFNHRQEGAVGAAFGAFHGLELFYLFQAIERIDDYTATDDDLAVAENTLGRWAALAASGEPNPQSDPLVWPEYTAGSDDYLEIAAPLATGSGLRTAACDFWDSVVLP